MRITRPTVLMSMSMGAAMLLLAACTGGGQQQQPAATTAPKAPASPAASPAASPKAPVSASPSPAPKAASPSPAAKVASPSPSPATKAASPSPSPSPVIRAASPSPSPGATTIQVRDHPQLGRFLTDGAGKTLYQFARDTRDTSNCTGECAQNWPPFTAPTGPLAAPPTVTGTLGTLNRPDGTRQVSYNGLPLYYFARDVNPGDTNGANVANWSVVKPEESATR